MYHRENMPSLFHEFQRFFDEHPMFQESALLTRGEATGLSLYEDDENLYLEAAVPGLKPDQIQISVEKGVVWIRGEVSEEKTTKRKVHFQSHRSCSYRIPLPVRIDENVEPEAAVKDGILSITFKKSRSTKPIKISVKEK